MPEGTATRFELLDRLVAADLALRPERKRFRVTRLSNRESRVLIRFPRIGGDESFIRWHRQDIEELAASGFIRLDRRLERAHDQWHFDISDEGFAEVERRASAATAQPDRGTLDWDTEVLPVLEAAYRASAREVPELGVSQAMVNEEIRRDEADPRTSRVLGELVHAGFLRMTLDTDQMPGPAYAQLTEKGLQHTAGWPTSAAETGYARLLAEIERRIDLSEDDDERTRWERFREGVTGVGRDVVTSVLSSLAEGAVRGMT